MVDWVNMPKTEKLDQTFFQSIQFHSNYSVPVETLSHLVNNSKQNVFCLKIINDPFPF